MVAHHAALGNRQPAGWIRQEAQITYLIGRDPGSTQNKLFALHRMSYAEVLHGEPLDDICDFDIDAYLAAGHGQFYTRETMQLHATVTDQLARILSETPLSDSMQLNRDNAGLWILQDKLPDTALLRDWINKEKSKGNYLDGKK